MQARLPIMLDDPQTSRQASLEDFEEFTTHDEEFFLDGPVSRRVAVLDFDHQTGSILPGARFVPPGRRRKLGRYEIPREEGIYGRTFQQVNAFATVLRTMYLFEEPNALGRRLTWSFGAPQIFVIPRSGEEANAFYDRQSHTLEFFYQPDTAKSPVYTVLSRDIISHETAHAILDGIAPDLYNTLTVQSQGLHEAVADLTALLMSFCSPKLRRAVLRATRGSLSELSAFNTVAPELASAIDKTGCKLYLRSLVNDKKMTDVDRNSPHALSEVLTGALYAVLVRLHGSLAPRLSYSASGRVLSAASTRFQQMILRALDYLPPGEVSFSDYCRAVLTVDQVAHPADLRVREWLRDELVRREIVPDPAAFDVRTNFRFKPLEMLDLQTLSGSDWAAYAFVNKHRSFFGIPRDQPFRVCPRLDTTKLYELEKGKDPVPIRELILKVSWPQAAGRATSQFPDHPPLMVGATLVIDWQTRMVRACIASERIHRDTAAPQALPLAAPQEQTLQVSGGRGSGPGLFDRMGASLPVPLPGVDAGAFYDLVRRRGDRGFG